MQAARDPRALERLRGAELGPQRHQTGHLGLGDVELLAAEIGQCDILDDVIGAHPIYSERRPGRILVGVAFSSPAVLDNRARPPVGRHDVTRPPAAAAGRERPLTIRLISETPPRCDKAIVFACDGNYAPFAWFAAAQIAALAPGRDFDICLAAMETPAPVPGLAELGVRLCRVETGGIFADLCRDARRTEAAYLRYALPAPFAASTGACSISTPTSSRRRAISRRCSTSTCSATRWGRCATIRSGARPAQATVVPAPRARDRALFQQRTAPDRHRGLRGREVLDRCLALGAEHPPERIGLDQELINATLRGDWAELSPVWNWQYTWASRLLEAMVGANIVHFIGHRKPWRHDGGELPLKFRPGLRRLSRRAFPRPPAARRRRPGAAREPRVPLQAARQAPRQHAADGDLSRAVPGRALGPRTGLTPGLDKVNRRG